MTQRNPNNERYREENRGGKTRKSAASAKPSAARAATVHEPAPKTKKQKQKEARERGRDRGQEARYTVDTHDNKYIESLPEYKKLRKLWWGCLIAASGLIIFSILAAQHEVLSVLYIPCIILGYLFVIAAFFIDFKKIRDLRREYTNTILHDKSKEARAQQKAARAEARAQKKEAEEKFAAAQAAEAEKKAKNPLNRLKAKFSAPKETAQQEAKEEAKEESKEEATEAK